MFGEYAVYCDEKVVALVCDDEFFLKPTDAGRSMLRQPDTAPPYPGARLYWRIPADAMEDREWFSKLVRVTADALPRPKERRIKRR